MTKRPMQQCRKERQMREEAEVTGGLPSNQPFPSSSLARRHRPQETKIRFQGSLHRRAGKNPEYPFHDNACIMAENQGAGL